MTLPPKGISPDIPSRKSPYSAEEYIDPPLPPQNSDEEYVTPALREKTTASHKGEDKDGKPDTRGSKQDQMMLWDPEDWNVRRREHYTNYYTFFLSNDFIDLWGAHRCPALEKRNHPFSKESPFILYPGKYVFQASTTPDDRHYIAIEVHYHRKNAKKATQVLVYVPEEYRVPLPKDSSVEDQYAASFMVLSVNQIDWTRTDNARPTACTWGDFALLSEAVQELSALSTLPDMCYKSGAILPSSQKRHSKNVSRPIQSSKNEDSLEVRPRPKRHRKSKAAGSGSDEADEAVEEGDNSDVGAETAGSAMDEPPIKRTKSKSSVVSVSKRGGPRVGASTSAILPEKGSHSLLQHAPQPPPLPTSASIWPGVIGASGLNDSDRAWLSTETRRQMTEILSGGLRDFQMTMLHELRASADRENTYLREAFRDIRSSLNAVSTKLSKVDEKVEEIGGTPSFTWDQIVAQCKQFQEIQMFSKSQDKPPQHVPPPMGHTSSMYPPVQHHQHLPPQHMSAYPGGYPRPPTTVPAGNYGGSTIVPPIDTNMYPTGKVHISTTEHSLLSHLTNYYYYFAGAATSDLFTQQYPHFRVKSPSGAPPFLPAVLSAGVQSPPFGRKSLTEEIHQQDVVPVSHTRLQLPDSSGQASTVGQQVARAGTTSDTTSVQLAALQQMLPTFSREVLEDMVRKNLSSSSQHER